MKTNIIVSIALLLLFAGCNNRVELGGASTEVGTKEIVEVSFSADFGDFSRSNVRTYPTGVVEERKHRTTFKGLRVVFYSVDQSDPSMPDKVVYSFDKDISATKGVFSGTDLGSLDVSSIDGLSFKIKGSERIKIDDYIVYVFATLNTELKAATAVGRPFSALTKPMTYVDIEDFTRGNLHHNHYVSEPITISKELFSDNSVNRIYTLPPAKLSAINAMASVTWAPKVQNSNIEIIGDVLQFYADVQNQKYLLFPEYDEYLKGTHNLLYPIDANYTGFAMKSIEELSSEFMYRHNYVSFDRNASSINPDKVSNFRSIPENTLASGESKSSVVTRLIMRVRMIPTSLKRDLTPEQLASSELSWVNYLGNYYEGKEFVAKYNAAKAKQVKSSEDEQLIDIAERFLVNGNLPASNLEAGYEDSDVQYYHGCFNYFALPITHFTSEQLEGRLNSGGHFGVVRNHHYKIDIKSFGGLGKTSYTYFPYDVDLLSNRAVDQDQIIQDMDVVTNTIDVLY